MTVYADVQARLDRGDVIILDGASGTELQLRGVPMHWFAWSGAALETHRSAIRRGTYDVVVDGTPAGSVELNGTFEMPVEPGRHTVQLRSGRNSSGALTLDAAEGEIVAFRCGGKRILSIFLASCVVPGLALSLRRERAVPPPAGV